MSGELWVGRSRDFGHVVYDPLVQDDESDHVLLFVVDSEEMRSFDREETRGKTESAQNEESAAKFVESYRSWKERFYTAGVSNNDRADASPHDNLDATIADRLEQQLLPVLQNTQEKLSTREREIEELNSQIASLKSELSNKNAKLSDAGVKLRELENQQITQGIAQLELLSRQAAQYASGGNSDFREILAASKLDGNLPLVLATHLEARLRKGLKELDPVYRLFDLIKMAKESEVLDETAVDMAHIVRRQRNRIAHGDYTEAEATAIILITLYAAAILWPRLPKW